MKILSFSISLFLTSLMISIGFPVLAMQPLTDNEMQAAQGQALFNLSYLAPGEVANPSGVNSGVGFYKLGMEATIDINANIRKLQLGCGGRNGAGGCDIDIDNLSLSGDCTNRPSCSATLTNPFIQFAIKNPDSAALREVVGLRVSAEDIIGLLTTGKNGPTPNGINTLSGYLKTQATTGTTYTAPSDPNNKASRFGTSDAQRLQGLLNVDLGVIGLVCTGGCGRDPYNGFKSLPNDAKSTGFVIPKLKADFTVPSAVVTGNRLTSATIQGVQTTSVQAMNLNYTDGQLQVGLNQCVSVLFVCALNDVTFQMKATIQGIKANINFQEALGYIHKLPLSGGGFYLGLQQQQLNWPGAPVDDIAKPGWWMAFANPVDLGVLNTPDGYTVDFSSAYPQIANALSVGLSTTPTGINVTEGIGGLLTGLIQKDMGVLDLGNQPPALINLANVPLSDSAQAVVPNCYGGLTFC